MVIANAKKQKIFNLNETNIIEKIYIIKSE